MPARAKSWSRLKPGVWASSRPLLHTWQDLVLELSPDGVAGLKVEHSKAEFRHLEWHFKQMFRILTHRQILNKILYCIILQLPWTGTFSLVQSSKTGLLGCHSWFMFTNIDTLIIFLFLSIIHVYFSVFSESYLKGSISGWRKEKRESDTFYWCCLLS